MTHPDRDNLTAYAVGALDPGEEQELDRHVEGCERCAAELRHLAPAVGVLAESVEQRPPPPELRERLLATIRAEAASGVDPEQSPAPERRGHSFGFSLRAFVLRPAVALSVVAVAAAGIGGYLIAGDGGEDTTTVAFESAMAGAGASLEVGGDTATLEAHGMPTLSKGAVYQVWVQKGSVVQPSAAFVPHADGSATAAVPEALEDGTQVMVTEESMPGHRTPTLPPILSARIS